MSHKSSSIRQADFVSLALNPDSTWLAAAIALLIAHVTSVILTMCAGVAAYGGMVWAGP